MLYLVIVVAAAQIVQEVGQPQAAGAGRWRGAISRSFSWRAWGVGIAGRGAGRRAAVLDHAVQAARRRWRWASSPAARGTLGEFVMKALKRDAGVRNWGGQPSVTGAVGLLDRVAPLCFAAPVFFHSVRWYFGV